MTHPQQRKENCKEDRRNIITNEFIMTFNRVRKTQGGERKKGGRKEGRFKIDANNEGKEGTRVYSSRFGSKSKD